jgi:hypothetical protein
MRSRLALCIFTVLAWLGGCDGGTPAPINEPAVALQTESETARIRLDRVRDRAWKLTNQGVVLQKRGEAGKLVLALPGWIVARTTEACMPDIALGPKGEVVVTSNVIPTLWRIDPETLAVSVHPVALEDEKGRDVGFNILAYSAAHGAFFAVSHAHGAVWKINSSLTRGEKVLADTQSAQSLERSLTCATS